MENKTKRISRVNWGSVSTHNIYTIHIRMHKPAHRLMHRENQRKYNANTSRMGMCRKVNTVIDLSSSWEN